MRLEKYRKRPVRAWFGRATFNVPTYGADWRVFSYGFQQERKSIKRKRALDKLAFAEKMKRMPFDAQMSALG